MDQNNQYQQPPYQQPVNQFAYDPTKEVMSVGAYIVMFILSAIPLVNLVCWITWLVSPNTNKNKKNFIIAQIVMWVIGFVLTIVAAVIMAAMGVDIASSF